MGKLYEVSISIFTEEKNDIEIILESLKFLNGLTDDELLEYVDVYDYESKIDYNEVELQ